MNVARRIASFPVEAVRLAKQAINSSTKPLAEGLQDESYLLQQPYSYGERPAQHGEVS
jgi:hypothetical protein